MIHLGSVNVNSSRPRFSPILLSEDWETVRGAFYSMVQKEKGQESYKFYRGGWAIRDVNLKYSGEEER